MREAIVILPGNGIGSPLSTISRYAAYEAARLLREDGIEAELLAIGRLLARLEDAVQRAKAAKLAVIEGCYARCASKLLETLGVPVAAYVYAPDVMQACGIGLRGIDRKFLGPKGKALVDSVARATADAVRALAASAGEA